MSGSIIGELYDTYKIAKANGWLDRLLAALSRTNHVLVLGSTGVGKTQLKNSIKDINAEVIDPQHRTEFPIPEQVKINKNFFKLVDLPGQALHESRRMQAVRDALREKHVGVINVVCYGYHEYALDPRNALNSKGYPKEKFLAKHRKVEIQAAQEWVPILGSPATTDWLITVVSKAAVPDPTQIKKEVGGEGRRW